MGWLCHYSGAIYLGIASDCVDIAINECWRLPELSYVVVVFSDTTRCSSSGVSNSSGQQEWAEIFSFQAAMATIQGGSGRRQLDGRSLRRTRDFSGTGWLRNTGT